MHSIVGVALRTWFATNERTAKTRKAIALIHGLGLSRRQRQRCGAMDKGRVSRLLAASNATMY